MSTISLTAHPHISKRVGVPRGLYVRVPQGDLFGEPLDVGHQTEILMITLEAVAAITQPGTILEHPSRWRMAVAPSADRS